MLAYWAPAYLGDMLEIQSATVLIVKPVANCLRNSSTLSRVDLPERDSGL